MPYIENRVLGYSVSERLLAGDPCKVSNQGPGGAGVRAAAPHRQEARQHT